MATRPDLPPDVETALQRGDFVAAIRLLRERTGVDVPQARSMIERQRKRLPLRREKPPSNGAAAGVPAASPEGLSPGEVPRTRTSIAWWIAAALLAWLVWRLVFRAE